MLRSDDSNQQARQSWPLSVLTVVYFDLPYLVFLVYWKQLSPFLSEPFFVVFMYFILISFIYYAFMYRGNPTIQRSVLYLYHQ